MIFDITWESSAFSLGAVPEERARIDQQSRGRVKSQLLRSGLVPEGDRFNSRGQRPRVKCVQWTNPERVAYH